LIIERKYGDGRRGGYGDSGSGEDEVKIKENYMQ
jgi:hypothetical protein